MFLIVIFAIIFIIVYFSCTKQRKYWREKGIPHMTAWPIFGNMMENFLGTHPLAHIIQDMYNKFPEDRYFGFHHYSKPAIIVRDPDLIKQIFMKDTDSFPDRPPFLPEDVDPFFNKSLLVLKGKAWQRMRTTLSPTFTSSKLKSIFELMAECSKQFVAFFEKRRGSDYVDIKDAFTRFTNDVAASLALGVSCDSMNDRENEIYSVTKKSLSTLSFFKFFGAAISPTLMKLFKVTFFDSTLRKFLTNIIQETIKIREKQGIARRDMLHLLMEAKKGCLKNDDNASKVADEGFAVVQESESGSYQDSPLTDEDVTAQAILFYTAGFDTSANLMCILAYELAVNPDVQKKLKCEVDETLEECDGELTYEALLRMKYLDMVVSETLRLWPITVVSDRLSAKPYIIEPSRPEEKSLHLDIGTYIWLPLYSIHRDPKYFPAPNQFDPQRFNDENKHNILPFTYIPFGVGARSCIASRFALLESKVIIFYILSQFEIVPVKETPIPFVLSKRNVNLVSEGDLVLGLKPRKL